ncbi:hypothetical protein F5X98DRAFT_266158 [Xylaria grammica]|nr:hypothetical protein F5X98DRAFT_266158 [Xylaria grammica]
MPRRPVFSAPEHPFILLLSIVYFLGISRSKCTPHPDRPVVAAPRKYVRIVYARNSPPSSPPVATARTMTPYSR